MEIQHRNVAAVAAAILVLKDLNRVLNNTKASSIELTVAVIPLFGISWNREVCQRAGDLNKLLCRLRNSLLAPATYLKAKELFAEPSGLIGPVPPNWEQWMSVIGKFELDNSNNVESWREIAQDVRALGFETHWELSNKRVGVITETFPNIEKTNEARKLRQACDLSFMEPKGGNLLKLHDSPADSEKVIGRLRGGNLKPRRLQRASNSTLKIPNCEIPLAI